MQINDGRDPQTYAIIGAAMEVHRELGPGFLEKVYQEALGLEFGLRAIPYEREVDLPTHYKSMKLNAMYRADFLCYDDGVIVETKAIKTLTEIDEAQIIHYLKVTRKHVGLLLNFGSKSLQYKRYVV